MAENPFDVTKAVDFTDAQIAETWVDWPGEGAESVADPRSPMPTFLTGGKGGGRTHLLRHFSYPLQRLRHQDHLLDGLQEEGYLGVYFRCGGLNSSRFSGKDQPPETWSAVFAYYMEIWLGHLLLDLIANLYEAARLPQDSPEVGAFAEAVLALFDESPDLSEGPPLESLAATFQRLQRQLDLAINNAALTRELNVTILASPGRIVFGVPQAAAAHLRPFAETTFAYLFDEYENLTEPQQRYVNTLIREKQLPTTFLIGSRLYGLRTHATLSAQEENREGSEFQLVVLEDVYRRHDKKYVQFCGNIVRRRLEQSGLELLPRGRLGDYFVEPDGPLEDRAREHLADRRGGDRRPWLERLTDQLGDSEHAADADSIVDAVRVADSPLHEKFAIFLLYRAWADGRFLVEAAQHVREEVRSLLAGERASEETRTAYRHYRHDLYAQLLSDLDRRPEYYGFDSFVRMSGYLPRNLLVILKQVTRWSLFLGDDPFRGSAVTLRAQREGVKEASSWFLGDAKGLGRQGEETELAIRRLGSLFREMRYSAKPVEVSCSSFSTDRQGVSRAALRVLDAAVSHSLILKIPTGRRDRNSQVLHHKYQLNPMLAPLFDLSFARRGSASLSRDLLNSVFDPAVEEPAFKREQREMLARLRPPFAASKEDQGRLDLQ